MKDQLHQSRALNALAFDAIDSGDVEEVILVIVGKVTLHLRRVHAAVGLSHVNGRVAHLGEDVDRHPLNSEKRKEREGDQCHDDRDRTAESG